MDDALLFFITLALEKKAEESPVPIDYISKTELMEEIGHSLNRIYQSHQIAVGKTTDELWIKLCD